LDDLENRVVQRGVMRSLLSHLRPYLPENPEVLISHRLDGRFSTPSLSLAVWSDTKSYSIHIDQVPDGVVLAAGMTATVQIDPRPSASSQESWRFATKKYREALPGDASSRAKPRRRAVAKAQCVSTSRNTTASL
jgi:hypothetical protein